MILLAAAALAADASAIAADDIPQPPSDSGGASKLTEALATTDRSQMHVPGGGLLGGMLGDGGESNLPGRFELHEEEAAAAATAGAVDQSPTPPAASSSLPKSSAVLPLLGFDGKPLAETSAALDARCQAAVADVLSRAAASPQDDPPAAARPPTFYVDPLDGVAVAPLNGTGADAVRLVYLIGVGARPHAHLVVSRLLYALYNPSHLFLIHLDVKASPEVADACYALQRTHANVRVLAARRLVQWGMFSMVAPMIDAIRTALHASELKGLRFDFFINLSDADLALRTDAEMRRFLGRMRGRSLINIHEGGGEQLQAASRFINSHVVVECGGYGFVVANHTPTTFPLTHGCCIGRTGPAAFAQNLPLQAHSLLADSANVYTGSQWLILSYAFCHELMGPGGPGDAWLAAFERRLVPDESIFQTIAMHSPSHRHSLLNHNLRWIDWPHAHGDPNDYWKKLGSRGYIGGPQVLNASELAPVLASPYMFARKVDVEIDPGVLRVWDTWMATKLARNGGLGGAATSPPQAPIGHSPGDPQLSVRFRAPGVAQEATRRSRRRIAMLSFADGSQCGCGDGCGALAGGCCARHLCGGSDDAEAGGDDGGGGGAGDGRVSGGGGGSNHTAMWGRSEGERAGARLKACPLALPEAVSIPGGAPLVVSWVNRARFPVALSVLDYEGRELRLKVLRRLEDTAAFNSHEQLIWRARSLNGELLLETRPHPANAAPDAAPDAAPGAAPGAALGAALGTALGAVSGSVESGITSSSVPPTPTSLVVIEECEPRHRGAAALLMARAAGAARTRTTATSAR